ncbi:MAG: hypothetical protein QM709_10515 [Spongiibacteraceae bacterium]
MWKRLFIAVVIAWAAYSAWEKRGVQHGAGVLVSRAPQQELLSGASAFDFNGYRLTPLAGYDIEARLLARETYRMGREADLSPIDFGVGWGRMSDESILKQIDISQSNRFMHWRVKEFPIPQREIETSAANMHLIPADSAVARQLDKMRVGQIVRLRGRLVRADAQDGWHWVSSLSRDDTGAGACELFWVEQASAQ